MSVGVGILVAPLDDASSAIMPVLYTAARQCRVRRAVRPDEPEPIRLDDSIEEHRKPIVYTIRVKDSKRQRSRSVTYHLPYVRTVSHASWSTFAHPSAVTSSHHAWSDSSLVMTTRVCGMSMPLRVSSSSRTSLIKRQLFDAVSEAMRTHLTRRSMTEIGAKQSAKSIPVQ